MHVMCVMVFLTEVDYDIILIYVEYNIIITLYVK